MEDMQAQAPWCYCAKCKGEIYRDNLYYCFDDENICYSCMTEALQTAGDGE